MARPETVVDYEAWKRGYMPPSEHVLIDQLAHRGAKVIMGSDFGDHGAIWIVTRDLSGLHPRGRKALREIINDTLDMQFAAIEAAPSQRGAWG